MSCRTVMENLAKETNIDNQEEINNLIEPYVGKEIVQKIELEERIAENMARLGGSHEFWERRLTHGWDCISARLSELEAQGLTMEQIIKKWEKEI